MITIADCEKTIKLFTRDWAGRCHEIANLILNSGLIKGKSRYGIYLGSVADTSIFAGRTIVRHGWIESDDGDIVDFTRWVFEDVEPYIFICDSNSEQVCEYDIGASTIRASTYSPPPKYSGKLIRGKRLDFPKIVHPFLEKLFGRTDLCKMQCFWLANQTPWALDDFARPIYQTFIDAELEAFIPVDFRQLVFEAEH